MKAIAFIIIALLTLGCQAPRMVFREAETDDQVVRKYGEQALAFTVPQYSVVAFRPNADDDTYNGRETAAQRRSVNQLIHFFGGAITADCPIFTLEDEPGYVADAVDAVNERQKVRKVAQDHIRYVNQTGTYIFDNRPDDRKKPYGIIISNGIDEPRVFWGTRGYLKRVKRVFGIVDYAQFQDSISVRDSLRDAPAADTPAVNPQSALHSLIRQSLTIKEREQRGEPISVDSVIAEMNTLLQQGARLDGEQLLLLFVRDGGGWSFVTHPAVLQNLLGHYLDGPGNMEDKTQLLSRLLCQAILISDPGIVELLIRIGANPREKVIKEAFHGIAPDYFPTYETMRLLEDELGVDLYRLCGATPLWWLVLERAYHPNRRNADVLAEEMRKRVDDAGKVCNVKMDCGYLLDPEIYPADLTAWELAEKYGDEEVLAYKRTAEPGYH